MLKTLLISEIFPPKVGGSGRWFYEIYSRLPKDQYIVAAGCEDRSEEVDAILGMECLRWPLTMPSWGRRSVKQYLKLFMLLLRSVRSRGIDAIHCGRCLPEGLIAWLMRVFFGVPYICYVHGEELATYETSREYRLLSRMVYAAADRVIVNSENTARCFSSFTGISDSRVRLMHPGVDSSYFTPAPQGSSGRERLGWTGRRVILTVGRLQKRKGHDHTILSLKRIREKIPEILYVIVGDGEELMNLQGLVAAHGLQDHISFLGRADEELLLDCYQHCDLFVLANRCVEGDFEGFGMVLVEAQSCGKPVIAGMSGGTAETMIPGTTGLLVDAGSVGDIADAVIGLLGDDCRLEAMGKAAAESAKSRFDWNAQVRRAESIFSEIRRGVCRADA